LNLESGARTRVALGYIILAALDFHSHSAICFDVTANLQQLFSLWVLTFPYRFLCVLN